MKKIKIVIFVLMFIFLTVSNCKNIEKEANLEIPSIDQIKSDLLKKKLGTWTFAGLEEFENVDIIDDKLISDKELVLNVKLKLIDKNSFIKYLGEVQINYLASEDGLSWVFNKVEGEIVEDSENSEITSTEESQDDAEDDNIYYEEQEKSVEKSKSKIFYKRCEWCPNEFKYEEKYDKRIGTYYEGGSVFCKKKDKYGSASRGAKLIVFGAEIPKYCSEECACKAEN